MGQTYLARTTQSSFLLSPHPLSLWTNIENISTCKGACHCQAKQQAQKQVERVPWLCLQALPLIGNGCFLPPSCAFHRMLIDLPRKFQVLLMQGPVGFLLKGLNFSTLPSSYEEIHKLWKFWNQWLLFYKREYLSMQPLTKIA